MPEAPTRAELERHVPPEARGRAVGLMTDDEIRRSFRIAQSFAVIPDFKGAPTAEIAFAKMAVGRELGMTEAQAIMSIDFVEGGIMIRGVRLLAWLRQRPEYDYKIMQADRESATVRILGFPADEQFEDAYRLRGRWWEVLGEETFTVEDATTAGKIRQGLDARAAWNAYRKNMLIWRATSNAVKFHAPDIFNGMPVYTEADFDVDGTAEVIGEGLNAGGGAQGLDLGPKVEAILKRAVEVGHAGIADRATAEMTLGQQDPGYVEQWCANATRVLDEMEAAKTPPPDAEVVPEDEAAAVAAVAEAEALQDDERLVAEIEAEQEQRASMTAEVVRLEEDAEAFAAEGKEDLAADSRSQAATLRDEIATRWPDEDVEGF